MYKLSIFIAQSIIVVIFLNFEFRVTRELKTTHMGLYCFLSFNLNTRENQDVNSDSFDKDFTNIFISLEQVREIRNLIDNILEEEEEFYESDEFTDDISSGSHSFNG